MSHPVESSSEQAGLPQPPATPTGVEPPASVPRDFGTLARRISSRTTDLLAVAILLVGGLAIGGSLMDWWRAEPPVAFPASPPASPWDDPSGVDLDFGGSDWAVHRQSLRGSPSDAANAILARIRTILAEAENASLPPIDEAEAGLLQQLPNWSPVETSPEGRIYLIGGPLYWVIGTRSISHDESDGTPTERVIAWGLALPQPDDAWTVYLIRHQSARSPELDAADIPLPEGAARSLRIAGGAGGELSCFHGRGPIDTWIGDFDASLPDRGWQRIGSWLRDRDSASAVFERRDDDDRLTASIMIVRDAAGTWRGVIDIHPAPR